MVRSRFLVCAPMALALGLAGCTEMTGPGGGNPYPPNTLPPPSNLTYVVEPSGDPSAPDGVVLRWDFSDDPALGVWHVYSRANTTDAYLLRGSTTSNSFHDSGIPHLQYYVTAQSLDGVESGPSNVVTVDERAALVRPATLSTTTLNGAIALRWSDAPFESAPQRFSYYRVYSAPYDLDLDLCGTGWSLEGTTVSPEFIAGALTNGVPLCFAVSAVSIEGFESLWSPVRSDTPRFDARNILLYARQVRGTESGFRFWRDQNGDWLAQPGELGLIGSGGSPDMDFSVERDGSGRMYLTPVRLGTTVTVYGDAPLPDMGAIDIAPLEGYARAPIEALPGWGYVFQTSESDGFARYGAVRVSHVGLDFLILDWAYQSDPGNPDLVREVP